MQTSDEGRFAEHDGVGNSSLLLRPASSLGIVNQLRGLSIGESELASSPLQLGPFLEGPKPDQHSTLSIQGGGSTNIEELLLNEHSPTQVQDEESILSPVVMTKPSGSLSTSALIPTTSDISNISPALGPNGNAIEPALLHNSSTTSSYASHIRPQLRSYQSSPSIRLYIEKSGSKEFDTTSVSRQSKSTKRVSFDPLTLMADAARTGDLPLYKSMLAIEQDEGSTGTLEEIVNYQSVSRKLSSLHLAASYNHLELCRFLVEMGANVSLADIEGNTAMLTLYS
ncbi:hypothetical protein B0O80DRAFT_203573 [Mortierella sp. GBAus27b]|nr:hypothetical protein B0O80DRAFT_203573 [Mortierella sp. GBAus27b]